jgi:2-polyprenylphenol 6-hydroxylase
MRRRHEIAVVGGGVVGAATALALARQGFDVALVEKSAAAPEFRADAYDPRVYALAPGSVRFLDGLGVWARVAAQRVSPYGRMEVWEQNPAQALAFDAAELGVAELGFIVEDCLLRAALWAGLGGAVKVFAGTHVSKLALDSGQPRLTLANGDVLEAELAIAAEGADSALREWAGIHPVGWTYEQRSLVCHVETAQPHGAIAYQRFLPHGPLAFLPLADGRCSIVWSTQTAEADELLALEDADFGERLGEAIGHRLGAVGACSARFAFPLRLLHAEQYAIEGLALVGDSAHVVHPLAGQGLNLGLADAQALVDVVTAARAQRKAPGKLRVLQRYERRRKAENVEMLAMTDGLYRLFRLRVPGLEAVRELGMSLVSRAGPVKQRLARRAMGIG